MLSMENNQKTTELHTLAVQPHITARPHLLALFVIIIG